MNQRFLKIVFLFFCGFFMVPSAVAVQFAWDVPIVNEDGTPLVDISSYNLIISSEKSNYLNPVSVVSIPGDMLSYKLSDFQVGNYFAVLTALNESGNESGYSNEVSFDVVDQRNDPDPTPTPTPIVIEPTIVTPIPNSSYTPYGDFDGDGRSDVVTSTNSKSVKIFTSELDVGLGTEKDLDGKGRWRGFGVLKNNGVANYLVASKKKNNMVITGIGFDDPQSTTLKTAMKTNHIPVFGCNIKGKSAPALVRRNKKNQLIARIGKQKALLPKKTTQLICMEYKGGESAFIVLFKKGTRGMIKGINYSGRKLFVTKALPGKLSKSRLVVLPATENQSLKIGVLSQDNGSISFANFDRKANAWNVREIAKKEVLKSYAVGNHGGAFQWLAVSSRSGLKKLVKIFEDKRFEESDMVLSDPETNPSFFNNVVQIPAK